MRLICCVLVLLLSACASKVPTLIKLPPEPDPEYQQVKKDSDNFRDQYVRWGGKIISVENRENATWVEILVKPLGGYGRPKSGDDYRGRFIARIDGFLDPEHYTKDRSMTVYGKVETSLSRKIDDHPYQYPLVYAQVYYLWPEYKQTAYHYPYYPGYYRHPYFYSPYYRYHFGFRHFHHFQ